MNLEELKEDCSQKQKKGIHFIISNMVIAMIFRGHLLPYSWLYNSNSYLILSIIIPILSLIVGLNFANYFLVTMMIVLEIIFSILLSFENKKILKN